MRFDRLDLNLLVAFDALLEERSVSGAARRLNLSQSAMSASLARLREFFDDQLLMPAGRGMLPTRLGMELAGPVRDALILIRSTITTPTRFDPLNSDRTFSIVASDYVYDVMLADILRQLAHEAPNIKFDIAMPGRKMEECFLRGEIDLLITLEAYLFQDHPAIFLFEDKPAVVSWLGNPATEDEPDMAKLLQLPHVAVTFGPDRNPAFIEQVMRAAAIDRNIDITVQTFTAVPAALVGTPRVAIMNYRHACHFARMFPLRISHFPMDMAPLRELIQWHARSKNDQGLHWLVGRIRTAGQGLTADKV